MSKRELNQLVNNFSNSTTNSALISFRPSKTTLNVQSNALALKLPLLSIEISNLVQSLSVEHILSNRHAWPSYMAMKILWSTFSLKPLTITLLVSKRFLKTLKKEKSLWPPITSILSIQY